MRKRILLLSVIILTIALFNHVIILAESPKNYLKGKFYNSVKNHFLVATEKIQDSRFEKTVVVMLESNKDVKILASSPTTKYQIFKYQNHAYGIQFHIEIKNTTVNDWSCVPEYKSALEKQFGDKALEKFDKEAKTYMKQMNKFSTILYTKFKSEILKI